MRTDRSDEDREERMESGVSKTGSPAPRALAKVPEAGDKIGGKYELIRVLGSGAMGIVFEAMHLRLHQRLAIKFLRPDVGNLEQLVARFEREANASARLRSVHAARVIDVDTLPSGLPYLVMEYLEGRTLDAELTATGAMPVQLAVDIVTQIAAAMTEAHGLGIVHRDLKPANVFICRVGERPVAKVLDFGISKVEGDDAHITAINDYIGTPSYAAPEQLLSASKGDARSDVWSLGIILFELLTNRTPFVGRAVQVIAQVLTDPIPPPTELRPDLPKELETVLLHAVQRDPTKRFQSMREFSDALTPFGPAQPAATVVGEIQRSRGRLGEILVSEGLITQADLERALDTQRREGGLLGRVLLDLGMVGHADLLTAIAKQQGLPPAPPAESATDRERRLRAATTAPPVVRRPRRTILVIAAIVIAVVAVVGLTRWAGAPHGQTTQPAPGTPP
jgi:eukaryotic-like serine/threonine-protein kinase